MSTDDARTLLIVEDDLALQKQIKWSMDRFESVTAHDREAALAQAGSRKDLAGANQALPAGVETSIFMISDGGGIEPAGHPDEPQLDNDRQRDESNRARKSPSEFS